MLINLTKLTKELLAAGVPVQGVDENGKVDFLPKTTDAQREQTATLVKTHDPTDDAAAAARKLYARWQTAKLTDKSPDQVITELEREVESWTDLDQVKAGLRQWLPLILVTAARTADELAGTSSVVPEVSPRTPTEKITPAN